MTIVPYDELKDAAGFALLSDSAFGHPHTPEQIALRRRVDPRYRDPFGFALLEGKTLAGFLGVIDIKARTRSGSVVPCGGIHNVMTRPDYARRGIAVRLFEHVHDHFLSRGLLFSFLFTSRSLVAWRLYRKLGYQEMPLSGIQAPAAYQVRPARGRPAKLKHLTKPPYALAEKLFHDYWGRKRSTFVNDPGWLKGRIKWWRTSPSGLLVDRDGFACVEVDKDAASVYEFSVRNRAAGERLLRRIESLNRPAFVHYLVHDRTLLMLYRDRGLSLRPQSFYVCMAKPLGKSSLRSAFGPNFIWSPLDQF